MTIYDIANHFKISPSTVSKALNGASDISPEKRREILEYAAAVGYNSRRKNSIKRYIALLWDKGPEANAPLAAAADAFIAAADRQLVAVEEHRMDENFDLESFLSAHSYSGIFAPDVGCFSLAYRKLKETTVPLVLLGCTVPDNALVSSVCGNDLMAAARAVEYLSSLGHRQIAFIGGVGNSPVIAERFAGYIFGLQQNGLPYQYDLTYFGPIERQTGLDAAEYFLAKNKRITAFVCASEQIAAPLIGSLRVAHFSVPNDYSVITFNDAFTLGEGPLTATSILQDYKKVGEEAFAALKVSMQGYPAQHPMVNRVMLEKQLTCTVKKKFFPSDLY